MSEVAPTSEFKKEYKAVRKDPRWRPIFTKEVPFKDPKHRCPWDYVLDCFYNDQPLPPYFDEHPITLPTQKIKQIKKRLHGKKDLSHVEIRGLDLHFDGHNGDHLLIFVRTKIVVYLLNIGTHSNLF